jgi:TonB family protein
MSAFAQNYRVYDLPLLADTAQERKFKRTIRIALGVWLALVVGVRLLPTPAPAPVSAKDVLSHAVELKLTQPPPKPEVKKPEPKPLPKTEVDPKQEAHRTAQKAMNAMKDEFAGLRALLKSEPLASAKPLNAKVDGPARSERSLLTSNLTAASGGINTSSMSSGFGGGTGSLKGHSTMQGIQSFADGMKKNGEGARRSGTSGKASRSREEIEMVFDRNKASIYSLYNRALRADPTLQGKVVVQLTIVPTGEVTDCKVLSSELKNEELERKLVALIKMFHFESRDVELITTTKPRRCGSSLGGVFCAPRCKIPGRSPGSPSLSPRRVAACCRLNPACQCSSACRMDSPVSICRCVADR